MVATTDLEFHLAHSDSVYAVTELCDMSKAGRWSEMAAEVPAELLTDRKSIPSALRGFSNW